VDLNLDNFDLSKSTRVASQVSTPHFSADACASVGQAFWSSVDSNDSKVFEDDDRILLASLFNPRLSDRRNDEDQFVPPDTSYTYMGMLRDLLKEEDAVRTQRKDIFFSKQFVADNPGPLFPLSWKLCMEIEHKTSSCSQEGILHERPDYKAEARMLDHILQSLSPVFDKSSEDGIRFRVYKVGSLEVRTTQEPDGREIVGAVFCTRPSTQVLVQEKGAQAVKRTEKVGKVTMYVERDLQSSLRHYYVVLETDRGNTIVTEMHSDSNITWKEDPTDLEDRNSLAKVFRSKDCGNKGVTIRELRNYQAKVGDGIGSRFSDTTGKHYAQGTSDWALGDASVPDFASQSAWVKCDPQDDSRLRGMGPPSGRTAAAPTQGARRAFASLKSVI